MFEIIIHYKKDKKILPPANLLAFKNNFMEIIASRIFQEIHRYDTRPDFIIFHLYTPVCHLYHQATSAMEGDDEPNNGDE